MLRGNITMANDYEDYWHKKEANIIVKSRYISGLAKESNLDKWANYANRNSFDQADSKRQSRHDLDASNTKGRESDWSDDGRVPQRRSEGRCWADIKATSAANTYTGKGGSKRGRG